MRRQKGFARAGHPGSAGWRSVAARGLAWHTAGLRQRAGGARARSTRTGLRQEARTLHVCRARPRVHLLPAAPEGRLATAEEPPLPDILSCVEIKNMTVHTPGVVQTEKGVRFVRDFFEIF